MLAAIDSSQAIEPPAGVTPVPAFRIGSIVIDPPVVLAPMADVTNGSYRRITRQIGGPGLLVTELISTTAVHYRSARTLKMFDITEDQRPVSVQLFGSDPELMAEAARFAVDQGADIIDVNMGCWVPKVCKTGGGAAMLRDEDAACRAVEAIVGAVQTPVTVKMRAGWDYGHFATAGLAKRLEGLGMAALALHGRYAVQGHTGEADWELIRQMKAALNVPVIGNGDVKSPEDALRMVARTGCDGVMIGRAAIGNPWILRDAAHYLRTGELLPQPTLEERISVAIRHLKDLAEVEGEDRAVRHLRGQLPIYVRGCRGAGRVRDQIVQAVTIAEVALILNLAEDS